MPMVMRNTVPPVTVARKVGTSSADSSSIGAAARSPWRTATTPSPAPASNTSGAAQPGRRR